MSETKGFLIGWRMGRENNFSAFMGETQKPPRTTVIENLIQATAFKQQKKQGKNERNIIKFHAVVNLCQAVIDDGSLCVCI